MYIYLFFILIGILLFLWNKYDGFSIGILTFFIQSTNPDVPFSPAPEFVGDNLENARHNGMTMQEYIETQNDSDFPGGYTNYILVRNDEEEGEPCNEIELCEGIPTCDDLITCKLSRFGLSDTNIALLLDQYHEYDNSYISLQRLNFSKACSTRLGHSSHAHLLSYDLFEMIGQQVDQPAQYNELNLVGGYFDFDDLINIINLLTHENIFNGIDDFNFLSELIFMIIKALRLGISVGNIIDSLTDSDIFYNTENNTLKQLSNFGFNTQDINYWFVVLYLRIFDTEYINPSIWDSIVTLENKKKFYLMRFKDITDFTGDYTDL